MPVEFLSDEQAAAYGQFNGDPSRAELERFFFLDDADRRRVQLRRGDQNRVGFAVQVGDPSVPGDLPVRLDDDTAECRPVRR